MTQKLPKVWTNPQVCPNFTSTRPKFWSGWELERPNFQIWSIQKDFLTWFWGPGQKISDFGKGSLPKSVQNSQAFGNFVYFGDSICGWISKIPQNLNPSVQILRRNSVRIPLVWQIPLWRIWQTIENFIRWNFLKISQANFPINNKICRILLFI